MNRMTPMYCHSCTNLERAATATMDRCIRHKQPAFFIVGHCAEVGGKAERVLFTPREKKS